MIKLVGFDLDGTLVNSLEDIANALNYGLSKVNIAKKSLDEVALLVGEGLRKLIAKAILPIEDDALVHEIHDGFVEYYDAHYCDFSTAYDGVEDVLKALNEQNVKIFILSNKSENFVKLIAKQLFPSIDFFDVCGNVDDYPAKPDPSRANEIIAKAGVSKSECVYIGDSKIDIMLAKNTGIKSIVFNWGYEEKDKLIDADYIISSANEVIQTISKC